MEGYSFHRDVQAEVVDEFTIDIQCLDKEGVAKACPIFPRTEDPIRCHEFGPPPRSNQSPHTMSTATSNEILDYIRQARLRSSCFATRSKICDQEIERLIVEADPIPIGPERTAVLTKIADIVHDEYYYFPAFQVVVVYGMAGNLDWEPRYDPRLRVNAMRFTN